jgi:hypothetical protein
MSALPTNGPDNAATTTDDPSRHLPDEAPPRGLLGFSCGSFILVLVLGALPWMDLYCNGRYYSSVSGYRIAWVALTEKSEKREPVAAGEPQRKNDVSLSSLAVFFPLIGFGLLLGLVLSSSSWALPTMGLCSFLALGILVHALVLPIGFVTLTDGSVGGSEVRFTPWFWATLVITSCPMATAIKNEWARGFR